MFENITKFMKKFSKKSNNNSSSKETAKERLHLVLMQDRANVSADFLDLMRQEIIDVIKKYIEVDESAIDVRLTNKENEDGTNGAPALYANIPILNIKEEGKAVKAKDVDTTKPSNKEKIKSDDSKQLKQANKIVEENKKENKSNVDKKNEKHDSKKRENEEGSNKSRY